MIVVWEKGIIREGIVMALISLAAVFVLLFVGQTLNRLPRDILILKEHYLDKDWTEFYVHLTVCGFFWLGSVLLIVFIILPLFNLQVEGWTKLINIFRFLGR